MRRRSPLPCTPWTRSSPELGFVRSDRHSPPGVLAADSRWADGDRLAPRQGTTGLPSRDHGFVSPSDRVRDMPGQLGSAHHQHEPYQGKRRAPVAERQPVRPVATDEGQERGDHDSRRRDPAWSQFIQQVVAANFTVRINVHDERETAFAKLQPTLETLRNREHRMPVHATLRRVRNRHQAASQTILPDPT